MSITALVPLYGSNRMLARNVGKLLEGCSFVAIPFAGGMCEVPHITARTIAVNDLHRHIINLARCIADPFLGPRLYRLLRRCPLHPDVLTEAQSLCKKHTPHDALDSIAAFNYFLCAWMSRNGTAGTKDEFKAGLSIRWEAGGGDSAVRVRSAIRSLLDFRRSLARCTFTTDDAFVFLKKCQDKPGHGIYCDPPWDKDGEKYKHKFSQEDHRCLAAVLHRYNETRIVIRIGDSDLARELYPATSLWTWHEQKSRTAANKAKTEALIVRN